MGDGQDDHNRIALIVFGRHDDGARPVFLAFILTVRGLLAPEERIADDEAGLRRWKRHSGLFRFGIELRRTGRELGRADGSKVGVGEIIEAKNFAVSSLEAMILLGGNHHVTVTPVAGHRDGLR